MKEFKNNLRFSVSHTTRKMREDEVEGKNYYFIERENFENVTN